LDGWDGDVGPRGGVPTVGIGGARALRRGLGVSARASVLDGDGVVFTLIVVVAVAQRVVIVRSKAMMGRPVMAGC
jgi:hypothetical protein